MVNGDSEKTILMHLDKRKPSDALFMEERGTPWRRYSKQQQDNNMFG